MEWVETTAKSVDEAKEIALDRLGVAADEAEFDVVDVPKAGLFGRTRGEARVRARVKPTPVRPKQERRRRGGRKKAAGAAADTSPASSDTAGAQTAIDTVDPSEDATAEEPMDQPPAEADGATSDSGDADRPASSGGRRRRSRSTQQQKEPTMSNETEVDEPTVTPQEVGDAAVAFMDGLVEAFGATGSAELEVDGTELDVRVQGDGLGLLVGRGGRTLNAVQDLVRVAAQRRLGDHDTRLRIDVARYRERRAEALMRFAADVAAQVRESGTARSLEPMSSADRKIIHDALNDEEGVSSRSEGDDPHRRVVVEPD